jgi:Trypsin-like peptidase domain
MPLVPAQCWLRTFKIASSTTSATCFVIDRHDRQWLITAKHFLEATAPTGTGSMHIFTHEGKEDTQINPEFVPPVEPGADIAVFSLGDYKMVREGLTLIPSADGLILSQDVYFMGYPLPGAVPIAGTLPFVKRGIASQRAKINNVHVWWVDGLNNPGFSGGPVVFNQGGGIGTIWHVLGVVSAYITQAIAVTGGAGVVPTNSGIVVYDIKHAIDAIDAYVSQA